jgi:tetratricopeptide (TPR) repeat protein
LLGQANRIDEAIELLRQGINRIPPDKSLVTLYDRCSILLGQANRIDEAIELLHQGINRIPPDKNLYILYQTGSKIFSKANRVRDAIEFLKEGIHNIPLDQGKRYKLIDNAMLLCVASQNKSELEKILAGTGKHSLSPQSAILGKMLLAQMQQNWQQAAEIAEQDAIKFPAYVTLLSQAAFSWFCAGNTDKAKQTLQTFAWQPKQGSPTLWLKAWIELKHGDRQLATESLSAYLGRPIREIEELNETFLLALWDNSIDMEEENNLAFYFPTLPPSLTGLDAPVTRLQFSPPILSGILKTMSQTQPNSQRTQVFISYSHQDKVWLQKLQTHLTPFIRGQYLDVWDDTKIPPGSKWKEEIEKALASAKIAVFLVSPDFLASKFINEQELPPLLEASEREGLTILWIPVRPSSYKITKINDYQAAHNPSKPLSSLNDAEQDDAWVSICDRIQEAFES